MPPRRVLEVFNADFGNFYFTLGRGKPQQSVERLFFTHRGRILGCFRVIELRLNDGANIPSLQSLSGETSEWQIKPGSWVAICDGPIERVPEKLYYDSFRGWRYFDLEEYRGSADARRRWTA